MSSTRSRRLPPWRGGGASAPAAEGPAPSHAASVAVRSCLIGFWARGAAGFMLGSLRQTICPPGWYRCPGEYQPNVLRRPQALSTNGELPRFTGFQSRLEQKADLSLDPPGYSSYLFVCRGWLEITVLW